MVRLLTISISLDCTRIFTITNYQKIIYILGTPYDSYYFSSGHIGQDLTGNGHNLVVQGASTFAHTEGPLGETDGAVQFDGIYYGKIDNIDGTRLVPNDLFTIMMQVWKSLKRVFDYFYHQ